MKYIYDNEKYEILISLQSFKQNMFSLVIHAGYKGSDIAAKIHNLLNDIYLHSPH